MSVGLAVQSAEIRRDGVRLLGPLDVTVDGPGLTVVMGANGAGKSLFLRMAHGLIRPDAGSVNWAGRPAHATMASRGFMFQSPPLMRRSVAANIAFPLRAAGVAANARAERVAQVLDEMRLAPKAALPAAQLSGGERARMALARALVNAPKALLMDEPAAALDPASTRALEEMILQVAARGIPVLMSTHDIGQARRLAERVLFFAGGEITEDAPRDAFFSGPRSEAAVDYLEGRL